MSQIPPSLSKGDKVAIAAPARKISREEIAPSVALLESWGLEVVIPDGLYEEEHQMAGNDRHRAALMQRLLDDTSIKAIFCARGGYGTVRIIDKLNFETFEKHPKWIIGYSDVTVLHSHVQRALGIATLHATMPINIPEDAVVKEYPSTSTLKRALLGEYQQLKLDYCHSPIQPNEVEGEIVGGNLSILYSLCGSKSDIDTQGKILLIEDLDEYLYHIDRMMMNLKRSGKLDGLKAMLVGAMSDMHDNSIPFGRNAMEIIRDAVAEYDYPVFFTDSIGHVGTNNVAIPLGQSCRIIPSETHFELNL